MENVFVLAGMFILAPFFLGALGENVSPIATQALEACAAEEEGSGQE